jgi:hypothetical protein
MKLGFTEFSYGYAFTENLIRSLAAGPSSAPVFPNLIQEASLGYDVELQLPASPIFFQYKLPEWMIRRNTKVPKLKGSPLLKLPFFRMPLMRRDISDQHKLLVNLEAKHPGRVFYASPELSCNDDFNAAYLKAEVHLKSALFSPAAIGLLPDDKGHNVSYEAGKNLGWFCSEPQEIPLRRIDAVIDRVGEDLATSRDRNLFEALIGIVETITDIAGDRFADTEQVIRARLDRTMTDLPDMLPERKEAVIRILVLRDISRIRLGLDLMIAQPRVKE